MIIDNTKQIRGLLQFPEKKENADDDYFYVVQLLQRQKDNPTKSFLPPNFRNNSNRTLQQFQIYSLEDFDLKLPTIIDLAKYYQARAYINLNIKNSRDVFAKMLKNLGDRLETRNFTKLHRLYNEAVGETNVAQGTRKTWIVDVDTKDESELKIVRSLIGNIRGGGENKSGHIVATVPTSHGFHLITSTFDTESFHHSLCDSGIAEPDIHKNNPTILWMETDWGGDCSVGNK